MAFQDIALRLRIIREGAENMGQTIRDLAGMGKEVGNLSASTRKLASLKEATSHLRGLTKDLGAAKAEMAWLAQEMKKGGPDSQKLAGQFRNAQSDVTRLTESLAKQKGTLANLRQELRDAGIDTAHLASEQKRLTDGTKASNAPMGRDQNIGNIKAALGGLAVGATARLAWDKGVKAPVRAAIDFEPAMVGINGLRQLDGPKAIEQMRKDLLALSTQIPVTAAELATITTTAGNANLGKTKAELLDYAKTAGKMGVAFGLSAQEASGTIEDWRTKMDLSQQQAVSLADAITYLTKNMGGNKAELAELVRQTGGATKFAGLNEIQTAALGNAFLAAGVDAGQATMSINTMVGALTAGRTASDGQKKAFNMLGLDAIQVSKMMQKDAAKTIKLVLSTIARLKPEQQGAVMMDIFGNRSVKSLAPMIAKLDEAQSLTKQPDKYTGAMDKAYEARAATTASQVELLHHNMNRLGVTLGSLLLPGVNTLVGGIASVVNGMGSLAEAFPTITKGLGYAAATAIGGLSLLASGKIVGGILGIGKGGGLLSLFGKGKGKGGIAGGIAEALGAAGGVMPVRVVNLEGGLGGGLDLGDILGGGGKGGKASAKKPGLFKRAGTGIKGMFKGGLKSVPGNIGRGVAAASSGLWSKAAGLGGHLAGIGGKGLGRAAAGAGGHLAGIGVKGLGKAAGGLGKAGLKKIPLLGLLAGGGFAISRAMGGDWKGAGLELASGAVSTLPGLGTAASIGLDAALIARDIKNAGKKETGVREQETGNNNLEPGTRPLAPDNRSQPPNIQITQHLNVSADVNRSEFEKLLTNANRKLVDLIRQVISDEHLTGRRVSYGGVESP